MQLEEKCHQKLTGCPLQKKQKNQKRFISWWGQSPTGGLLRIVYAVTWLVVVMWPLFTKHANIYCGWTWCAVETSAANLSNSKLGNSNLVLILKGGKGQGELWLKVHTTILPYKNNLLNRQNNHTTAILTKTSLFFSLYNSLSQVYKTPAKDFTACLWRATQIWAFSARKQTGRSMMMM